MNVQGPGPKVTSFLDRIGQGLAGAVSSYAANAAKTSGLKLGTEETDSYHSASSSNVGNVLATARPQVSVDNLAQVQRYLAASASPNRNILAA